MDSPLFLEQQRGVHDLIGFAGNGRPGRQTAVSDRRTALNGPSDPAPSHPGGPASGYPEVATAAGVTAMRPRRR
jgi:hypothetical protein